MIRPAPTRNLHVGGGRVNPLAGIGNTAARLGLLENVGWRHRRISDPSPSPDLSSLRVPPPTYEAGRFNPEHIVEPPRITHLGDQMSKTVLVAGLAATGVVGYAFAYWLATMAVYAERRDRERYALPGAGPRGPRG